MPILRSRKTQFLFSSFLLDFTAFLVSGKHQQEERKTPIGPIHILFRLGPTQTSFSFPPAGTPEATSWEQGQMARPHLAPKNHWPTHDWPKQLTLLGLEKHQADHAQPIFLPFGGAVNSPHFLGFQVIGWVDGCQTRFDRLQLSFFTHTHK